MVSNASSTVHCLTPILVILEAAFGIRRALFTTIHSYTSAHRLADVPAEDKRRGRAAAENIIPQASRSPAMVLDLLPALSGKLSGYAMNVPVSNGSVVDLVVWHEKPVTARRDQRGRPRRRRARTAGRASSTTKTRRSSPPTSRARGSRPRSTRSPR